MYSAKLGRSVSTETIGDPVEGTAFSVEYTRVVRERGDGEARRALLVVVRGAARVTSGPWNRLTRRLPGRAGVRRGGHPGRLPAGADGAGRVPRDLRLRARLHPLRRATGAGPATCRVGGLARAPHGARHLPAARRRLHRGHGRGRLAALVPVVGAADRLRRRRRAGARRVRALAQPARRLLDRGGPPLDRRGHHRRRADRDRGAGGAVLGQGDLRRRPRRRLPDRGLPRAQRGLRGRSAWPRAS